MPCNPRIILTGYTDVDTLVEAINCGHVYRYVSKPWSNDELRLTVRRALEHYETNKKSHELESANRRLISRMREIHELATVNGEPSEAAVERSFAFSPIPLQPYPDVAGD